MTADKLNSHLANGGIVQVTTYAKSTIYTKKHAGWFSDRKDGLYVRHGKTHHKLAIRHTDGTLQILVAIRLGRYVEAAADSK